MKVEGAKKLMRQLSQLPEAQRRHIAEMQKKSGQEAARVMGTLVPRAEGDLAESIDVKEHDGGMTVVVTVGDDTKDGQIKARTVEGGRAVGSKGGEMAAQPFVGPTRSYLAKKHKARVKRAINKAAREVTQGGS